MPLLLPGGLPIWLSETDFPRSYLGPLIGVQCEGELCCVAGVTSGSFFLNGCHKWWESPWEGNSYVLELLPTLIQFTQTTQVEERSPQPCLSWEEGGGLEEVGPLLPRAALCPF